jgi:outer membrane lipoprotein carrier protein
MSPFIKKISFVMLLIIMSWFPATPFSFAETLDERIDRLQKAYEHLDDLRANFVQKSFIKDLKRTDSYSGELFIKKKKIKWEYRGDKPQAVYVNNGEIIIYQKKEKQAFKGVFDSTSYGQSPISLLSGFGSIREEFNISSKGNGLLLKPKKEMGAITTVELFLAEPDADFPIAGLSISDKLGNQTEIKLSSIRINTGIKDSTFVFKAPPGVKVLEQ